MAAVAERSRGPGRGRRAARGRSGGAPRLRGGRCPHAVRAGRPGFRVGPGGPGRCRRWPAAAACRARTGASGQTPPGGLRLRRQRPRRRRRPAASARPGHPAGHRQASAAIGSARPWFARPWFARPRFAGPRFAGPRGRPRAGRGHRARHVLPFRGPHRRLHLGGPGLARWTCPIRPSAWRPSTPASGSGTPGSTPPAGARWWRRCQARSTATTRPGTWSARGSAAAG